MHEIYLRGSKNWMSDGFEPTLPGQQLDGKYKVSGDKIICRELTLDPDDSLIGSCVFITNFEFRYFKTINNDKSVSDQEDPKLVAEVSAQFAADYLVKGPDTPPEKEFQVWARTAVILHCWPYWREYCQSSLARMHLPVAIMPLMLMPPN